MDIYCLRIDATGAAFTLAVNDAPLFAELKGKGLSGVKRINEWLPTGESVLSLSVWWPAAAEFVPGAAKAVAELYKADPDSPEMAPLAMLARLEWPAPNIPEGYPYRLSRSFSLAAGPPAALWRQGLDIAALTDADRREILALLERFRSALLEKNFDAAFQMSEYRFRDEALSYETSYDQLRAICLEQYGMIRKMDVAAEPLTLDSANFRIVAKQKLVQISRIPSGEEPLVIVTPKFRLRVPVYAAKLSSGWVIARG